MFAVYVNPVTKDQDGVWYFKNSYRPADDFDDFCLTLDTILNHYHLSAIGSEIDSRRNCIMIFTDGNALKICVEPNYYFNCMNYITLEEIKSRVDDAINKRITHVCSRCGRTEDVCFSSLKDMSNDYEYLPYGWKEVHGNKLCFSCYKKYYGVLFGFMENNLKNS